ncbi:3-hydroxyacyl-CoA dehydrogenase NAD-binding domain-containing protein [Halomonas sp. AOP12-C2-37]|uniref:3-hydroxyacyl-CoA dehydrogenase NAD-binding domain-containing protein n=1 Tax=unclassified Halomonas TaxID=2609666 RepID=UPI0040335FAD
MNEPSNTITRIAVIGCGTIGISWAAYFLSRGLQVTAFDPDEAARSQFTRRVADDMRALGGKAHAPEIADSLEQAVRRADLIVENAPESAELKQQLLIDIQRHSQAWIASSTSSLRHSDIALASPAPERIVIAHPFNPPHLVPLVELYGIDNAVVERLAEFYRAIGKQPVIMRKEMIGHIANRLSSALWREALYLLQEGVASVEDIDRAVTAGPGLRWAFQGPFLTYHLGGGQGGIRHYLEHLGPSQEYRWASLGQPDMNTALFEQVIHGVESATDGKSITDLSVQRDQRLIAVQKAIAPEFNQEGKTQ